MEDRRRKLAVPNDALEQAVAKTGPLRGSSRFAVSTARREIHGDPLHRTALPPTLRGFFYCGEHLDKEPGKEDELVLCSAYGEFISLPGPPAVPRVDPSFAFLTKALPKADYIFLAGSCNGLLLFGHLPMGLVVHDEPLCYIVCNPATEQWAAVPPCEWVDADADADEDDEDHYTAGAADNVFLLFDPAVSSHFHVLLFAEVTTGPDGFVTTTVHAYSSETRAWRHSETDWTEAERQGPSEGWRLRGVDDDGATIDGSQCALVNGKLYLILGRNRVLELDEQGKTQRIIPAPAVEDNAGCHVLFLGQSQGRLHCIVEEARREILPYPSRRRARSSSHRRIEWVSNGLSIWVLHDSGRQEWDLKGTVSIRQLFGRRRLQQRDMAAGYRVVGIHPDRGVLFILQHWDALLISYDVDRREVHAIRTLQDGQARAPANCRKLLLTPYAPYLSELFLGVIGAHKLNVRAP